MNWVRRARRARAPLLRSPVCFPLVLLCALLVVLASAQRRVWEADYNNPGVELFKSGETGKVVNLVAEFDRVKAPLILGLGPTLDTELPAPRHAAVPLRAATHPEPRAPPR